MNLFGLRSDPGDVGPCYDFCACRNCWNGWTEVPFWVRLRWRLHHIWRVDILRRAA